MARTGQRAEALFAGEGIEAWSAAIRRAALAPDEAAMLDLEQGNLGQGLLALVVALLEVVKEALVHAAVRRVEGGRLSDAEVERLGDALAELEEAVAQIKAEHGVEEAVQSVRDDLDQVVSKLVDTMVGRERWPAEMERDSCAARRCPPEPAERLLRAQGAISVSPRAAGAWAG